VSRGRKPRRPRTKRSRLVLCAVVAAVAYALWTLIIPAGSGPPQLVSIPQGSSAWQVASMLGEKGIARSSISMAAAAYLTGRWRHIRAGRQEVGPAMNALEILALLCRESNDSWVWLTIPEGYTLRQIAGAVQEAGLGDADSFTGAARAAGLSVSFPVPETGLEGLPAGRLEGYLFPDTYRVDPTAQEADIVKQMLHRFEQVVYQGLFSGQPTYRGRSLNEVIILASLVEAEAKHPKDRPVIAGVLMNRLREGQRLECDATVQYALGDGRKERLSYADTQVESPYNTYLHAGLTPGPICNPGEASIRAAMDPANVPYFYYVARPDGSHVFSRTLEEHQAAIARIRSGAGSQPANREGHL